MCSHSGLKAHLSNAAQSLSSASYRCSAAASSACFFLYSASSRSTAAAVRRTCTQQIAKILTCGTSEGFTGCVSSGYQLSQCVHCSPEACETFEGYTCTAMLLTRHGVTSSAHWSRQSRWH